MTQFDRILIIELYANFKNKKMCLRTREEIGAFLNKEYEQQTP